MKRAVSLILSLLLALSLSACGGEAAVYPLTTSTPPAPAEESAPPSPAEDPAPPSQRAEAIFQAPSPDVSLSDAPQALPEESTPAPEPSPEPSPEPEPSPTPEQPEQSDPGPSEEEEEPQPVAAGTDYVLNTNTKKFHIPSCSSVDTIKPKNRQDYTGTRDEVIAMGFDPCGRCHP